MSQFVFVVLSIVLVKVIDGQVLGACDQAQQSLSANQLCVNASIAGNNATLICDGTCRDLYEGVIAVCPSTSELRNLIYHLCDPCGIALIVLTSDDNCSDSYSRRDTANICMGTCHDLIDDIIQMCDNLTSSRYSNTLNLSCSPCQIAEANSRSDSDCAAARADPHSTEVCTGTCRALIDDVINNCDPPVSSSYNNAILFKCRNTGTGTNNDCETAVNAVDNSCALLLNTANPNVCSGACGAQVSTVGIDCASISDPEIQEFVAAYHTACLSGTECTAALTALNANATCVDAVNNGNTAIYCSGTCRELFDDVLNVCPNNAFLSREEYNQDCGFGSDSGCMLPTSGTITVLIIAVCALIL